MMPSLRRRRRPRVAIAALLTCCTPCVALHLPTRRGVAATQRPAQTARAAAAAVLDEKPPVAVGAEPPVVVDAVDALDIVVVDDTKPQRAAKQRRRPEAQGPIPTLVLPGDTLDDAPHMALAVAASFLASLWGVVHNAQYVARATTLIAVAAGFLGAELFSGVFHWATDNYGSLETPVFGPACAAFQGHHGAPWTITHRSTFNNVHKIARMAGPLALLAGVLMKPFAAIATSVLLWGQVCAQEAHRWSHVPPSSQPSFVRRLQACGLLLSSEEHGRHHRSPYAEHYCILFGGLNPLLDRSGIFRWMEKIVYRWNGVEPNSWKDPIGGPAVKARALGL